MAIIILLLAYVAFDRWGVELSDDTAGALLWIAIIHDLVWFIEKLVFIFGG